VYCPGDTVTGELRLSTDAPVESRGLHIRLEHKSVVHWHELEKVRGGRDDNNYVRVDYHGEKVRDRVSLRVQRKQRLDAERRVLALTPFLCVFDAIPLAALRPV
jgi:hypothetical protein